MRFPKIKIYKVDKKRFLGCTLAILVIIVGTVAIFFPQNTYKTIDVDNSFYEPAKFDANDYELPSYLWKDLGYDSVIACYEDLVAKREEAVGAADDAIEFYSSIITDEEKELLKSYEFRMTKALTIVEYNEYLDLFNEVTDEIDMRMPTASYSSGGSYGASGEYYSNNGNCLTKHGGVFHFNGRKETWYSTNEAGQMVTAVNIPGRYVGSDGVIRDANGYICVAASDLPIGSIVETSLGTGKVYDTGCAAGTTDIYTNW